MNRLEARLQAAIENNEDPAIVSPTKIIFAWRPVYGYDWQKHEHCWIFWQRVIRFTPLGMFHEYQTYVGSEYKYRDKHGRNSWQTD
jgi:hypothetical protein